MKKQIIAIILGIGIVAFAILISYARNKKHAEMIEEWKQGEVITITIQPGDTIDGYWVEYAPDFVNRYEWREIILDLNNMENCNLYAGDTIKIIKEAN